VDKDLSFFVNLARRYFWVLMGAVLFIIGFVTLSGGASNASGMGFGVIATLVGGFLFFQSLRRVRMEQRLRRAGIVTEATVTAVTESNFSVNRVLQWVIRYRYADYRGGSYEGQSGYISAEEAVNCRCSTHRGRFSHYDN